MLDKFPLDILIIIINFLSFSDIVNLFKLYNHNIFEASRYLKTIRAGIKFRVDGIERLKLIKYIYQPDNLYIRTGSSNKNNILDVADKNNWKLKKVIFNNCRGLDSDLFYDFLKKQNKIELLELYGCFNLEKRHLLVINENIKYLSLRNNSFKDQDIKIINRFKKLEKIDLSHGRYLHDIKFEQLNFNNLRSLILSNNILLFNNIFYNFLTRLTKLEELNLDFVIIDYSNFLEINKSCPKIKTLSLVNSINYVVDIPDEINLQNKWHNMEKLVLTWCVLNDDKMYNIIDNVPNLKFLDVTKTNITDLSIIYLTLKLPSITHLSIGNNDINNISLNHIAIYLNKLKILDLSNCHLDPYYIKKIIKNNPLDKLYLVSCEDIYINSLSFGVRNIVVY